MENGSSCKQTWQIFHCICNITCQYTLKKVQEKEKCNLSVRVAFG